MKTLQYFTDEYLEQCKKTSAEQRLEFLENFRRLQEKNSPTKLISIKIPENLLKSFRDKCEINDLRYQTQIKNLMKSWLK